MASNGYNAIGCFLALPSNLEEVTEKVDTELDKIQKKAKETAEAIDKVFAGISTGEGFKSFKDAVLSTASEFDRLKQSAEGAASAVDGIGKSKDNSLTEIGKGAEQSAGSITDLTKSIDSLVGKMSEVHTAIKEAVDSGLANYMGELKKAKEEADQAIKKLKKAQKTKSNSSTNNDKPYTINTYGTAGTKKELLKAKKDLQNYADAHFKATDTDELYKYNDAINELTASIKKLNDTSTAGKEKAAAAQIKAAGAADRQAEAERKLNVVRDMREGFKAVYSTSGQIDTSKLGGFESSAKTIEERAAAIDILKKAVTTLSSAETDYEAKHDGLIASIERLTAANKEQLMSTEQLRLAKEHEKATKDADSASTFAQNAKSLDEMARAYKYLEEVRNREKDETKRTALNDELKRTADNAKKAKLGLEEQAIAVAKLAEEDRKLRVQAKMLESYKKMFDANGKISANSIGEFVGKADSIEKRAMAAKMLKHAIETLEQTDSEYAATIELLREKMEELADANKEASDGAKELEEEHISLCDSAKQLAQSLAIAFSVSSIKEFLGKVIDVHGQFEMTERALGALLGSTTQAKKMFAQSKALALQSPFSVMDITQYIRQLAAYRIEEDKLFDTTKRLADVSAGLGVDMQRLILAYGQVKAAAFLKGTEVRQFTEAGVNVYAELQEYYSEVKGLELTTAEIVKMISARKVTFGDVEAIFQRMTDRGGMFYNMQAKQASTMQGMVMKLKDAVDIMVDDVGKDLELAIKGAIDLTISLTKHWKDFIPVITAAAGVVVSSGFVKAGAAISAFAASLTPVGLAVVGVSSVLGLFVKQIYNVVRANREFRDAVSESNAAYVDGITELRKLENIANAAAAAESEQTEAIEDNTVAVRENADARDDIPDSDTGIRDNTRATEENTGAVDSMSRQTMVNIETLDEETASLNANTEAVIGNTSARATNGDAGAFVGSISKSMTRKEATAALGTIEGISGFTPSKRISEVADDGLAEYLEKVAKEYRMFLETRLDFTKKSSADELSELKNFSSRLSERVSAITSKSDEIAKAAGEAITLFGGNPDMFSDRVAGLIKELGENPTVKLANGEERQMTETENAIRLAKILRDIVASRDTASIAGNAENEGKKIFEAWAGATLDSLREAFKSMEAHTIKHITSFWGMATYDDSDKYHIETLRGSIGDVFEHSMISALDGIGKSEYWDEGAKEHLIKTAIDNFIERTPDLSPSRDIFYESANKRYNLGIYDDGSQEEDEYPIGDIEEGDGVNDILQKRIRLLDEMSQKYEKYRDMMSDAAASQKTFNYYLNSLEHVSMPKNIMGMLGNFNEGKGGSTRNGMIAALNELLKTVEDFDDKEDILSRIGELNLAIDNETLERELEQSKKAVEDAFSGLDLYRTLKESGLGEADIKTMFPRIVTNYNEVEKVINEKFADKGGKKWTDAYEEQTKKLAEKQNDALVKEFTELVKEYKNAMSTRLQIDKWYWDEQAKMRTSENFLQARPELRTEMQSNLDSKYREKIDDAAWEEFRNSDYYTRIFDNLEGTSTRMLNAMSERLKALSDNLQNLSPAQVEKIIDAQNKLDEMSVNRNPFKHLKSGLAEYIKNLKKRKALEDEIAENNKSIEEYDTQIMEQSRIVNEKKQAWDDAVEQSGVESEAAAEAKNAYEEQYKILEEILNKKKEISDETDKQVKSLGQIITLNENTKTALTKVGNYFGDAADIINSTFDALNDWGISAEIPDWLGEIADGFSKIDSAISEIFNGEIIGGTINLLGGIGKTLGGMFGWGTKDNRLQKKIEALQDEVDELSGAFEKLEKAITSALSFSDISQSYEDAQANLEQQIADYEEMIRLEEEKKNTDSDLIKEYQEAIEELEEEAEDLHNTLLETLGGVSTDEYRSAAEEFAEAWIDAFNETEDTFEALTDNLQDYLDNMLKQMVTNAASEKFLQPIFDNLNEMVEEAGDITGLSKSALDEWLSESEESLEAYNDFLEYYFEKLGISPSSSDSSLSALQQGIQSITEETGAALESILNSMRFYLATQQADVAIIKTTLIGMAGGTEATSSTPMLTELKAQTALLQSIDGRLSSVIKAGHRNGGKGLNVFID